MNIQQLSSILHEVGHAIGCVHEHSSPASTIKWNKPVVYQALAGPPNNWDKAKVDFNVFERYAENQTQFSAFDSGAEIAKSGVITKPCLPGAPANDIKFRVYIRVTTAHQESKD